MKMTKATRARYTLEFKQEAMRLVESGQSIAAASRTLGLVEQTLFNSVKAHREGTLKGADSRSAWHRHRRQSSCPPLTRRVGTRQPD
jgi:transposase-like protein